MRNVLVMGTGMHRFGRFPGKSFEALTYPAIENALEDAAIPFKDIEVAFCGVAHSSLYDSRRVIQQFGWTGIMIHSLAQASGSSAAAFRMAYWTVASGIYDTALVVGYEKTPKGMLTGTLFPGRNHLDVMGLDPIPGRLAGPTSGADRSGSRGTVEVDLSLGQLIGRWTGTGMPRVVQLGWRQLDDVARLMEVTACRQTSTRVQERASHELAWPVPADATDVLALAHPRSTDASGDGRCRCRSGP